MAQPVTVVTRLRLDGARYDPAATRRAGTRGRPRGKGKRQPRLAQRLHAPTTVWQRTPVAWDGGRQRVVELASHSAVWYHRGQPPVPIRWLLIRDPLGQGAPQALRWTALTAPATQIGAWFVQRWRVEVTLQAGPAHLGLESQRQWSDLASARTTPALRGLFSLVTRFAHQLRHGDDLPPRQAAWYTKALSTFSDTWAFVRYHLWPTTLFSMALSEPDIVKIPRAFFNHLNQMLAYAA